MISDPNPVLIKVILSVSENYPKVYYDAQHTFLCSVYFASQGKITSVGMHALLSWPWHL